jgi:CheY-like chemotaxis protein
LEEGQGRVVAVVGDLFFQSKIRQTAQNLGVAVAFATTEAGLGAALAEGGVRLVILDLGVRSLDPIAAIGRVRSSGGSRIVAFVSHVDEEAQRRAAEAGCAEILPKSAFTRDLARILQG